VAGGELVKVIATGKGDLIDLKISKEVVDPNDIEMLQDLVITAVRDAVTKAAEMRETRIKGVIPPGFNLPGLF
jgi:DNA-binding YbaB/EbfC family protein